MAQARIAVLPERSYAQDDTLPKDENPGRAFAMGILLSVPLWALVGLAVWAIV